MENRIARFLFGHYKVAKVGSALTVASAKSLAVAVSQINGLFLDSKTVLRAHTVSVYAGASGGKVDPDMDSVNMAFKNKPLRELTWTGL